MRIKSIHFFSLHIPFKLAFKHASAERIETQTIWGEIHTEDGLIGYGEGCPRDYVTAENLQTAKSFLNQYSVEWFAKIKQLEDLRSWVNAHEQDIDKNPAAWCALELAFLDVLAQTQEQSVESLLGLPEVEGKFQYSAVLGDAAPEQFAAQLQVYVQQGFSDFKIKLSGNIERDKAKIAHLKRAAIAPTHVRADANNLWPDADTAIVFLKDLDYPFHALEEPLRVGDVSGMARLARELDARIILDESLTHKGQFIQMDADAALWMANMRISKMGGVLRSLEMAKHLAQMGYGLIIGAHVGETSLLTRVALTLGQNFRGILTAQEGAFSTHLLTGDVSTAAVMFGKKGLLDTSGFQFSSKPGWGLDISLEKSWMQELMPSIS